MLGIDIPNDKQTVFSLQYLYGVGPHVAAELCKKAGIKPTTRARDLNEDEVGRLAGLPAPVIARARALLAVLEGEQLVPALGAVPGGRKQARTPPPTDQLGLFGGGAPDPLVERLRTIDTDTLTPKQALALLAELSEAARGESVAPPLTRS